MSSAPHLIETTAPSADFTAAMSALASGVVVVTCHVDERPWGTTVTAFTSVSADPPTVLVLLRSDTAAATAIVETGTFGVRILGADQVDVAAYASPPAAPKFLDAFAAAGGAHGPSPAVAGALAHLDCELDSFHVVKRSGYFAAPVPEELGGLGVTSVHDLLVASCRLARGDAALTLGVNMHLVFVVNVVRRWQIAVAAGDERRAAGFGRTLEQVARDGIVFASAVSEPRQDLTRPATTATQTDAGWTVSGRKVFSTMSPAADVLYTAVTYRDDVGRERYGYAMIPRRTPGVIVHQDWDALGMRASGQQLRHVRRRAASGVRAPRRLRGG